MKNGVDYLGFHFYLTDSGKVVRKVRRQTKYKYKRKLKAMEHAYKTGEMEITEIRQVLCSYHAHLSYGHTYHMRSAMMKGFVLHRQRKQ